MGEGLGLGALSSVPHPREEAGVRLPLPSRCPSLRPQTGHAPVSRQPAQKGRVSLVPGGAAHRLPATFHHSQPTPVAAAAASWGQGLLLVLDSNLRPAPHTPGVVPDRVSPALYPEMQLPELFLESDWPGRRPGCGCQPLGLLGLLLSLRARLGLAPT